MTAKLPTRIFLDNSVLSLSGTMRGVAKNGEVTILGKPQKYSYLAYEKVPPLVGKSQEEMNEQINCLPTVARLAREGILTIYSYSELGLEASRESMSFPADPTGRLFADVNIQDVQTPIERSRYFQLPLEKFTLNDCMIKFCKWLLEVDGARIARWARSQAECTSFELSNFHKLDRFHLLCSGLSENQYPDAFHLWTAELHGIPFF